jgi:hypothetical protein
MMDRNTFPEWLIPVAPDFNPVNPDHDPHEDDED